MCELFPVLLTYTCSRYSVTVPIAVQRASSQLDSTREGENGAGRRGEYSIKAASDCSLGSETTRLQADDAPVQEPSYASGATMWSLRPHFQTMPQQQRQQSSQQADVPPPLLTQTRSVPNPGGLPTGPILDSEGPTHTSNASDNAPSEPRAGNTPDHMASSTPDIDWDFFFNNLTAASTPVVPNQHALPLPLYLPQNGSHALPVQQQHFWPNVSAPTPDQIPAVSPASDVDVFETAKGLAMISLEAAAEPHYVGESSGSLWTTVIAKGMQNPRLNPNTNRAIPQPVKPSRSPSPARLSVLRTDLRKPISDSVSQMIFDTVYQQLHSRVSYTSFVPSESSTPSWTGLPSRNNGSTVTRFCLR